MREWSLKVGDPLALTIAADMRLCTPDYLNDHIWELEIGTSEPVSLAVRTTYGLRALGFAIFYRFSELGKKITNPAEFHAPPRLRAFYPNFLLLNFHPFEGLEVTAEYWIPESHALCGRLTIVNHTAFARKMDFEVCGLLTPLDGQPLAVTQHQMINVLAGKTGGLTPVLFMTGGPTMGSGPYPSLAVQPDFDPAMTRSYTWSVAAEASMEASFESARMFAGRAWDAERARIELLDAGSLLEIQTGNVDWDAALAFSQKSALAMLFSANQYLPNPSFVRSRQPDSGYSHKGDGSDYPPGWSGQSPMDVYYMASLLGSIPSALPLVRGLLENFLSVQSGDGSIDAKPGLSGQRAKFLAAPLLCSLAWNYFTSTGDETFLASVFPRLFSFFMQWFSPALDPDGDGIPAWNHVLQMGFDDHPLFDVWHPWSQGVDISAFFNPELEALLYREAGSLILMAEKLEASAELGVLQQHSARLRSSVEAGWNPDRALYGYRDRLTGLSQVGKRIGRHNGSGEMRPRNAEFEQPVRLLIEVQTKNVVGKRLEMEITGFAKAEKVPPEPGVVDNEISPDQHELIEERQFQWRSGGLVATSGMVYGRVRRITIRGLDETDRVVVRTTGGADTTDITLFTPIWAHLSGLEQVKDMLAHWLTNAERFGRPFGIPAVPFVPKPVDFSAASIREVEAVALGVQVPWNQLIGEGLLIYGFREEAARLTANIMKAVILSLKQNHAFYERYNAQTGIGLGERGSLNGIAPIGLFLKTLGVELLSPTRVRLEGKNPFEWPVTISYKGMRILRGLEATEVVFPNGQMVTVRDPARCLVSQ